MHHGALSDLGETFDIDRDDLDRVLRQVERRALMRTHAEPTCADIMSRDVIKIDRDAEVSSARDLLLAHGIRTLPVHDGEGRLMGTVGLREVLGTIGKVGEVMRPATIAHPETSAVTLVEPLTDGRTHAVVITDAQNGIVGLVTQTDLLAAVTRQRLLTMRTKEAPTS